MSKTSTLDFSAFLPVDSIHYEIRQQGSADGTGWVIELADASHPKALAWSNEQARKSLKRQEKIEVQQLNGHKVKPDEKNPDEVRKDNVGWVLSRIIGWSPAPVFPFIGAEPVEFSDENAAKVLMHPKMGFALAQLIEVIGDERSFTKASAKS